MTNYNPIIVPNTYDDREDFIIRENTNTFYDELQIIIHLFASISISR
jgi:hypothetical protein|tara:strand:- start:1864 stop:2004 length:141 start_codon:yes stop_codon:yes gene_type:complete